MIRLVQKVGQLENVEKYYMPKGIIILGPAGAGKTTLGSLVALNLGIVLLDIDEYIWRKDTDIPYTVMYSKKEKIDRLMKAVKDVKEFVMSGSMNSFHEYFDPMFLLAVYLTADSQVRAERVHNRELKKFGNRILPGGDMYQMHQAFLEDVAKYNDSTGSCNNHQHELWLSQLMCHIIRLDGRERVEINAEIVIDKYQKLKRSDNSKNDNFFW